MTYGENSKPAANSKEYRDNYGAIVWPKKEGKRKKESKKTTGQLGDK